MDSEDVCSALDLTEMEKVQACADLAEAVYFLHARTEVKIVIFFEVKMILLISL